MTSSTPHLPPLPGRRCKFDLLRVHAHLEQGPRRLRPNRPSAASFSRTHALPGVDSATRGFCQTRRGLILCARASLESFSGFALPPSTPGTAATRDLPDATAAGSAACPFESACYDGVDRLPGDFVLPLIPGDRQITRRPGCWCTHPPPSYNQSPVLVAACFRLSHGVLLPQHRPSATSPCCAVFVGMSDAKPTPTRPRYRITLRAHVFAASTPSGRASLGAGLLPSTCSFSVAQIDAARVSYRASPYPSSLTSPSPPYPAHRLVSRPGPSTVFPDKLTWLGAVRRTPGRQPYRSAARARATASEHRSHLMPSGHTWTTSAAGGGSGGQIPGSPERSLPADVV
ncbi:hypothetical protein VTO73DRAFT_10877 [Trametes versicolor]